jgi:hypothetical protein
LAAARGPDKNEEIRRDDPSKNQGRHALPLGGVNDRLPRLPPAHEETSRGLRVGAKLIIPLGVALSCIAHLALLTPAVYLGARPFDPAPADAITVDIVSADEAGKAPKADDTAAAAANLAGTADKDVADAKTAAAPVAAEPILPAAEPQPQPQPSQSQPPRAQAPQSPPAAPALAQDSTRQTAAQVQPIEPPTQPAVPAMPVPAWLPQLTPSEPVDAAREGDAADRFPMPLALPGGRIGYEYQGAATEKSNLSEDAIVAFRKQFKTCATALPATVTDKARVTLRIDLNPDGTLVKSPENPRAVGQVQGVSVGGGDLFLAAKSTVRKCQPYKMLPPDKYAEWKTLDVPFTRDNF